MMKISACCECAEFRACMAVDCASSSSTIGSNSATAFGGSSTNLSANTSTTHYCLLHFSISQKNSVTPTKNSRYRNRVTDQEELAKQEKKVKEMWKGAAAEVILKMFDYEKADQKAARLAQAPAIVPRKKSVFHKRTTVTSAIITKSSDSKNTADFTDADDAAPSAPSYSWRRGAMADEVLGTKL